MMIEYETLQYSSIFEAKVSMFLVIAMGIQVHASLCRLASPVHSSLFGDVFIKDAR